MKKLILFSLCLLAGAATLPAQSTLYVIDNETVEHFDGSQLKGKTIKEYKITTSGTGRNALTVHAISTSKSPLSFSGTFPSFQADTVLLSKGLKVYQNVPKKVVYVIDGVKQEDASAFQSLSAGDIDSISVLKEGEDSMVISVSTKK